MIILRPKQTENPVLTHERSSPLDMHVYQRATSMLFIASDDNLQKHLGITCICGSGEASRFTMASFAYFMQVSSLLVHVQIWKSS